MGGRIVKELSESWILQKFVLLKFYLIFKKKLIVTDHQDHFPKAMKFSSVVTMVNKNVIIF